MGNITKMDQYTGGECTAVILLMKGARGGLLWAR